MFTSFFLIFGCTLLLTTSVQAQTQDEKKEPQKAPWYSLFSREDRSDQFARLRLERLELTRELNSSETEVRELRQKNVTLDEATKALLIKIDNSQYFSGGDSDEIKDQLKKKEFDRKQLEENINADIARMKKELEILKSKSTRTSDEESRLAKLPLDIEQGPEYFKRSKESYDFEVETLKDKISRIDAEESQRKKVFDDGIANLKKTLSDYQKSEDENVKRISELTSKIGTNYDKIDTIDAEILKLIDVGDADGWYKIIISLSFAFLVASVIYGFYRVVGENNQIVETIFSNDSGIQFITLFSIVIAVILFGIIGVLEGKELSALLGGLSGYILGRNSANQQQRPAAPPAPAPQPALPQGGAQAGAGAKP
ncbi:MAG: hypothetical protein EOQ29_01185 [Mesorhizobium sp.]|nr:MAG: hypothetical protein EOQ29_01185 [Mesorhizobium sp.]